MDLALEGGISDQSARLLNELILSEMQRSARFEVLGGSDVKALLGAEEQKMLLGCTDESCLSEIGGALDTDYVALASVGKVGDRFLINFKLINVRRAAVEGRSTVEVRAEGELVDAVRRAVARGLSPGSEALETSLADAAAVEASQPVWPWILVGTGAAAVLAGGITLGLAPNEQGIADGPYRAYRDYLAGGSVQASERDRLYADVARAVDQRNQLVIAGWASLGAGLALASAGLVGWLLSDGDPGEVHVEVSASPAGALMLRGSF